jgi:hypothetical protein
LGRLDPRDRIEVFSRAHRCMTAACSIASTNVWI